MSDMRVNRVDENACNNKKKNEALLIIPICDIEECVGERPKPLTQNRRQI